MLELVRDCIKLFDRWEFWVRKKTEEMPDALADFEASAYKCTQVRRNPKMEGKECEKYLLRML